MLSAENQALTCLTLSVPLGQDADHEARVEEAITRMLVCAIKSAENPCDGDLWLNPTEVSPLLLPLQQQLQGITDTLPLGVSAA